MSEQVVVSIVHEEGDLGNPGQYSSEQLQRVKNMISKSMELSIGGVHNLVKPGDKVMIKINTVSPSPPEAGYTTDPRTLHALIEILQEANPREILIGERSAQGRDTMTSFEPDSLP